jgi:hypothetical protein
VISGFRYADLFAYICSSRASSNHFTFICVEKHRPVAVLDILDGVYPRRKGHGFWHGFWMMQSVLFVQVVQGGASIVQDDGPRRPATNQCARLKKRLGNLPPAQRSTNHFIFLATVSFRIEIGIPLPPSRK